MEDWFQRWFGFERLVGPFLIRLVYAAGIGIIVLAIVASLLGGVLKLPTDPFEGLGQLVVSPLIGVLLFVFWRFFCELALLAFRIHDRLGEIRDRLHPRYGAALGLGVGTVRPASQGEPLKPEAAKPDLAKPASKMEAGLER